MKNTFCFVYFSLFAAAFHLVAAPVFDDATKSLGLMGMGGGTAAWVDFNNDGWDDLHTGTLWVNEGGKKFTRFAGTAPGGSGTWADFNNDGWIDCYAHGSGRLWRNDDGKGFTDITPKLMTQRPAKVCLGAAWADFDGDGWLDLYVGGYEIWQKAVYPDIAYRNLQGKGWAVHPFPKVRDMTARGIAAADYDGDGDTDIYVSNYRLFPNRLWRNDGKGTFAEVAAATKTSGDGGLGAWGHTIGSSWGDLDNDGHLDLFVGNFSHPPAYQDRAKFLRNRGPAGKFSFEDKSAGAGLHWQESYASPTLGDYDNDGYLDLFFTTVYAGNTSVLYQNSGNWKFKNTTGPSGIRTATTYQAAWADFDKDGDLDLASGGKLWRNQGNTDHHWLAVRLKGKQTIGATARLKVGEQTLTRHVASSTGQGNQDSMVLHFGLGTHDKETELKLTWPGGKKTKHKLAPNKYHVIESAGKTP